MFKWCVCGVSLCTILLLLMLLFLSFFSRIMLLMFFVFFYVVFFWGRGYRRQNLNSINDQRVVYFEWSEQKSEKITISCFTECW